MLNDFIDVRVDAIRIMPATVGGALRLQLEVFRPNGTTAFLKTVDLVDGDEVTARLYLEDDLHIYDKPPNQDQRNQKIFSTIEEAWVKTENLSKKLRQTMDELEK